METFSELVQYNFALANGIKKQYFSFMKKEKKQARIRADSGYSM